MKKLFIVAAIALLGGMVTACSSDDDKIVELQNGPFEGFIQSSFCLFHQRTPFSVLLRNGRRASSQRYDIL